MKSFHRIDSKIGNKVLDKFNHTCTECGSTKDVVVHHIVRMNVSDPRYYSDENNLTVLCRKCHMKHHRSEKDIDTAGYGRRGNKTVVICGIEDCNKPQHALGLCPTHYRKLYPEKHYGKAYANRKHIS